MRKGLQDYNPQVAGSSPAASICRYVFNSALVRGVVRQGVRFVVERRVPFGHCDPAQVAYYPRFFEWFHDAFEAFFEPALGLPYAKVLSELGVGFPAVQVQCEYQRPARFGDLIRLEVFLSALSPRSATFEYRVRKDDVLLATASIKVAFISFTDFKPATLSEAVLAKLEPYREEDQERPDPSRIR